MKKAHLKILQQINASIPKELTSKLMREVDGYSETKKLIDIAIKDPDLDEEKRESLKNLVLSGHLDSRISMEEDPEVNQQIYQYIMDEVTKKVEAGELPKAILKEKVVKKTKQQK